mmetsp:Transcript_49770/g.131957  ORF Transcript_49770/g.131957 Transcript_49770/m.131957 type:complete len:135 (+) Transcript_49770:161-565(+)
MIGEMMRVDFPSVCAQRSRMNETLEKCSCSCSSSSFVWFLLGMVSGPLGAPAQTSGRIPPPVVVAPGVSEFTATLPAFRPPLRRSAAVAGVPSRIAAGRQPRHPPRLARTCAESLPFQRCLLKTDTRPQAVARN